MPRWLTGARALTCPLPNSPLRQTVDAKTSMPLACRQEGWWLHGRRAYVSCDIDTVADRSSARSTRTGTWRDVCPGLLRLACCSSTIVSHPSIRILRRSKMLLRPIAGCCAMELYRLIPSLLEIRPVVV